MLLRSSKLTIAGLNAQSATLNTQLTALNTALASAPAVPTLTGGQPTSDETTATALGDNPLFEDAVKAFNPATGATRLSAEQQIDNYINFQYEMVAKQLTLLRDRVGPNSRVLSLNFRTPFTSQASSISIPTSAACGVITSCKAGGLSGVRCSLVL